MSQLFKKYFWVASLIFGYLLFSVGQFWLFFTKSKESGLYERINNYGNDWVNSHLVLLLGVLLIIPATLAINFHLTGKRGKFLTEIGTFFVFLGVFSLVGQFVIDFLLVEIFTLEKTTAYSILEKIQANQLISFLFYSLAGAWFIGQILVGLGLTFSKSVPPWAIFAFFFGLVVILAGQLIHNLVGKSGYLLFSIAYLPIAKSLLKE